MSRSEPGGKNHWSKKDLMVDGDGLVEGRSREAKAVAMSRGGALSGMSLCDGWGKEWVGFRFRAFKAWSFKVIDVL